MASVSVEQLVLDLADPATRENALLDLSKKRESFPELAPYLWHSFGTVSALLQVRMFSFRRVMLRRRFCWSSLFSFAPVRDFESCDRRSRDLN